MAAFADDVVKKVESFWRRMWKKEAQDGYDEVAGIVRCEGTRRKSGNDHGPNKRGPPVAEPFHSSGPLGRENALIGREFSKGALFASVIWSFASDDNVVHVAFEQAGRRDADELAAFLKIGEIGSATIAHAATQAADELVHQAR